MAIKVNNTIVIDDSRNIANIGVATATSFSGSGTNLTGIVTSIVAGNNVTVSGSTGQVTVGISTDLSSPDLRIFSTAEKIARIDGNTVNIVYGNFSSGNVGLCTNPTGDITVNVTDIPTDSTFDNSVITFSIFVNQTGTSRTCTAVNLNGVSKTIKWAGGSLNAAISGVTTSNGFDIFNFTGINTVGSASTTDHYQVLGIVNGDFR